jgi:hypothetical protein
MMLESLNANAVVELPNLRDQAERLIGLGLHELAGITARALRDVGRSSSEATQHNRLLAFHPDAVPASALAPLLHRDDKPGFVVTDMVDVDRFAPIDAIELKTSPLYLLTGLDRGDDMANWSPDEALPALIARGRTPLLLTEGILWNLQVGAVLERNHCYMTIGSRLRKPNGSLDSRTPALWISNGTGRDGPERRNAPKVGWCWAGNRHTWLGFASAADRQTVLL